MSGPSTLGGILNEIALARVAFADDGTLVRSQLRKALTDGPQDPRSQSQRLQNAVSQQKVTPTLAQKLYNNEVVLNDTTDDPRHRTILRHTLRNIASGATGSVRDKVEGAVFAADIGYELQASPDNASLPSYEWAGSAAKRPLIDLMVNTEHKNPDRFVRAVELAERSLLSGNNNDRAALAAALEQDGNPLSGAVARFTNGVGVPSRTAVGNQLPESIRHSLTILYADALANGTVPAFQEYLAELANDAHNQSLDLRKAMAGANASYRATIAVERGKSTTNPRPPTAIDNEGIKAADDFARQMVEFLDESKAIGQEAKAKTDFSNYIQKAKGFARPAVAVAAPAGPAQGQLVPAAVPAGADEAALRTFYRSLVATGEVERLKNEYFLGANHLRSLPDNYPKRAALLEQHNIIGERLIRLAALEDAMAGKTVGGDRVRRARAVIDENVKAIAEARRTGASTVLLKDPTRWDKSGAYHAVRWPLSAVAQPVAAVAEPVQQPTTPQETARQTLDNAVRPQLADRTPQERAQALRESMLVWAGEEGARQKGMDQATRRRNQEKYAYVLIDKAKVGAASHGNMRVVVGFLQQTVAAEYGSMEDPMQLAMTKELKLSDLQMALKSMGSSVSAADILNIGAIIDKGDKTEFLKSLPSEERLAAFVARMAPQVKIGAPSSAVGMNATELYYIISKIQSVKFVMTEGTAAGGMSMGQAGEAPAKKQDATGEIEGTLFGERVSPIGTVVPSIPIQEDPTTQTGSQAVGDFILNNAGTLMPAELIRVLDGDSVVMGVCGHGQSGEKYCVRMHVRVADVSAKEKDNTATNTIHQKLNDMVDLSIRVNPSQPVARYDRWAGIIYGKDAGGKIHKINIELKELGIQGQGGFDRRYGSTYDDTGTEPTDAAIMDSLGGTGNRDPLFGETQVYEGVVHDRPANKTEVVPIQR